MNEHPVGWEGEERRVGFGRKMDTPRMQAQFYQSLGAPILISSCCKSPVTRHEETSSQTPMHIWYTCQECGRVTK
jgi:hypothetical protein